MATPTHYELLGVAADAGVEDVRRAYQQCALLYHPDKSAGSGDIRETNDRFLRVQAAWEVLRDADARAAYDAALANTSGQHVTGFVGEELELDELELDEAEGVYSYPCRCGESYTVLAGELAPGAEVVVGCEGCSLHVLVRHSAPVGVTEGAVS